MGVAFGIPGVITKKLIDRIKGRDNSDVEKGGTVTFDKNNSLFQKSDFSKGDNFTVKSEGGLTYKIQSGGEETDAIVLSKAKGVKNDTVFACNEKIYLKHEGKVYIIEKRDLDGVKSDYSRLYSMFYG